jgi:hypothetical protein
MFRQQLEFVCAQPMWLRARPPVVIPPHSSHCRRDHENQGNRAENVKIKKTDSVIVSRFRVFSFVHFTAVTLDLSPNKSRVRRLPGALLLSDDL